MKLNFQLLLAGSASPELRRAAMAAWVEAARATGYDVEGFNPEAPLQAQLDWARRKGFRIAATCSRFSTKLQQSTEAQTCESIRGAAAKGYFVPADYICVDEGISGRKNRRPGLDRLRAIVEAKLLDGVFVFKISRLFRSACRGYAFVQEELVEEGVRCVAVGQGIDTADEKTWKLIAQIHGVADELLLEAIADHVRAGIGTLFRKGWTTGALPVGYKRVEIDGPLTNLGRPRTRAGVDEATGKLIETAMTRVRDGMAMKKAWRKYVDEGGPADPRSTHKRMTYRAFRRMLSNPRYIGIWTFGRKRNRFSSKRDYVVQTDGPELEVITVRCEELRIVSDELFFALQRKLGKLKTGSRGPRKERSLKLWDYLTEIFHCAACQELHGASRFHIAGGNGKGMRCKHGEHCPSLTVLNREKATNALCEKLAELILADTDLLARTLVYAAEQNAAGDELLRSEADRLDREEERLLRRISDLADMAGASEGEDRIGWKARTVAAQHELAAAREERARLQAQLDGQQASISAEQIRRCLEDLSTLLRDAAAGSLGDDETLVAARIVRQLVGERVLVHVERRKGRSASVARGTFTPQIVRVVKRQLDDGRPHFEQPSEVSLWLRKPPLRDLLAERVHELYDVEKLTREEIVARLDQEGHAVKLEQIWHIRRRFWEMCGEAPPPADYNNGRRRKGA